MKELLPALRLSVENNFLMNRNSLRTIRKFYFRLLARESEYILNFCAIYMDRNLSV